MTTPRKMDFLEAMFQRYPDVPREVIIKEDLLREGVVFSPEAARSRHTYQLFSWERQRAEGAEEAAALPLQVPNTIELAGGIYGLRRTRVRPRLSDRSSYHVELREGVPTLCAQGQALSPLCPYPPVPAYYDKTFPDGTRYGDLAQAPAGSNHAFVIAFNSCQYWGPKEECRFCDINENFRLKRALGQYQQARPFKDPVKVGQVLHEVFCCEKWTPDYQPRFVFISGGQITGKLDGNSEVEFYLRYIREARAGVGPRWPIRVQIAPMPRPLVRGFREAGLTSFDHNLEVWDKRIFQWVCPGKSSHIGWENWVRLMVEAVEELGQGFVMSSIVTGVEMARPYGFETVSEAVKSSAEGFDFLMRNGVFPQPSSWCVSRLSDFRDQEPPPLEYFIEVDRAWCEVWKRHRLLPPPTAYPMGPGVSDYPNSAVWDMA